MIFPQAVLSEHSLSGETTAIDSDFHGSRVAAILTASAAAAVDGGL